MQRIIVGAGGTAQAGWRSLERGELDIRDRSQWLRLFRPGTLTAVLSEHVLEHLTIEEALQAARNIYEFLKPGGYWRVAVPDRNNPDPAYHDWNAPEGSGQRLMRAVVYSADEPCHQVFYDYRALSALLSRVGFIPVLLEWCDERGRFLRAPWSKEHGEIKRSFDNIPVLNQIVARTYNASLIIDAVKPSPF